MNGPRPWSSPRLFRLDADTGVAATVTGYTTPAEAGPGGTPGSKITLSYEDPLSPSGPCAGGAS